MGAGIELRIAIWRYVDIGKPDSPQRANACTPWNPARPSSDLRVDTKLTPGAFEKSTSPKQFESSR